MAHLGDALTDTIDSGAASAVAGAFRAARLQATALGDFPGAIPASLSEAYLIQSAAIQGWPDTVAGWKVGRITGEAEVRHGVDRLIGPVFARLIQHSAGPAITTVTAIHGGFCAVEAELVFRLGRDAPATGASITGEAALDYADALLAGVEIAGSPLATINDLGPTVVVSDFGNNAGLVIGGPIRDWRARLGQLEAETRIDGAVIATGVDAGFPGGIAASLAFAIQQSARMGMPLKAGTFVSTGAITGVHDIRAGQSAEIRFGADGRDGILRVRCVPAVPRGAVA